MAYQHVDAATIHLVTDPGRFDVIVTDNLFGDIITDLAAAVCGGIGLAASGNIDATGPIRRCSNRCTAAHPTSRVRALRSDRAIMSVALLLVSCRRRRLPPRGWTGRWSGIWPAAATERLHHRSRRTDCAPSSSVQARRQPRGRHQRHRQPEGTPRTTRNARRVARPRDQRTEHGGAPAAINRCWCSGAQRASAPERPRDSVTAVDSSPLSSTAITDGGDHQRRPIAAIRVREASTGDRRPDER